MIESFVLPLIKSSKPMWIAIVFGAIVLLIILLFSLSDDSNQTSTEHLEKALWSEAQLDQLKSEMVYLLDLITTHYELRPCFKCHGLDMRLSSISPSGQSVEYKCTGCGLKMKSRIRDESDKTNIYAKYFEVRELIKKIDHSWNDDLNSSSILQSGDFARFQIKAQGKKENLHWYREVIPDHVSNFVMRRDKGICVKCGSSENIKIEPILPISEGGLNSEENLHLICLRCKNIVHAKPVKVLNTNTLPTKNIQRRNKMGQQFYAAVTDFGTFDALISAQFENPTKQLNLMLRKGVSIGQLDDFLNQRNSVMFSPEGEGWQGIQRHIRYCESHGWKFSMKFDRLVYQGDRKRIIKITGFTKP